MRRKGDEPIPGFKLVERLGRGAFGEVWKATGPGGTWAALKFISLFRNAGRKEFRALQRVKQVRHVHLTPITGIWLADDHGRVLDQACWEPLAWQEQTDASLPAELASLVPTEVIVAMPLGEKDLAARLAECRAAGQTGIPLAELLGHMKDAAEGLDYLNTPRHDLGDGPVAVQHGDVKPKNLLLLGGSVQVCDFGLARVLSSDGTTTGIGGSPAYVAPECLRDRKPSLTADQYSLAITYVELRTGELPFDDTSHFAILEAHVRGSLNLTRLPPAERAVVARATAQDPHARFANCAEFVRELENAQHTRHAGIACSVPSPPHSSEKPADVPQTHAGPAGSPASTAQQSSCAPGSLPQADTAMVTLVGEAACASRDAPPFSQPGPVEISTNATGSTGQAGDSDSHMAPPLQAPTLGRTVMGGATLPLAPPGIAAPAAVSAGNADRADDLQATRHEESATLTRADGSAVGPKDLDPPASPSTEPLADDVEQAVASGRPSPDAAAMGAPMHPACSDHTGVEPSSDQPACEQAVSSDATRGEDVPPPGGSGVLARLQDQSLDLAAESSRRIVARAVVGGGVVLVTVAAIAVTWFVNRGSVDRAESNGQPPGATTGTGNAAPTTRQAASSASQKRRSKPNSRPRQTGRPRKAVGPELPDTNDAAELLALGRSWLAQGEVQAADAAFSKALELDKAGSLVAELHTLRGRARLAQGLFAEARGDFDRALQADEANLAARLGRAWALAGRHDYGRALAEFQRLRDVNPSTPDQFAVRGSALHGITWCGGEVLWEAALADYTRAVAAQSVEAMWLVERAECHRKLGHLDAARDDLQAALKQAPQLAEVLHGLGLVHRDRGNYRPAAASLAAAVALRPQQAAWLAELAEVHYLKGDTEAALAEASRALEIDRIQPLAFLVQGLVHRERGDYTAALLAFNSALRWRGFEPLWLVERATVFYRQEEYSLALADVQRALELNAALAPAANLRGLILLAQGQAVDALSAFSEAIRLSPSQAQYYANRADVYRALGQIDQALVDLNVALGLNADSAVAYNLRGLCYFSQRDYASAVADFTQALRRQPTNAAYYHNRGDANYRLGNLTEALADFTRSLAQSSNVPYTLFLRGSVYLERGEYALAAADFDAAIQLAADQADYYAFRADAYLRQGDYEKAMADAEQAIKLDAHSPLAYRIRGAVHEARQNSAQAAKDFAQAGEEYISLGDYERGKAAFSDAIRIEPKNALHYAGRANCLYKLSAYTDALTDATRAIELDPNCERAWNMRANTYDALGDFEHAVADYTEAIRLAPTKAVYVANRGDVYLSHRDYQLAIADFTKAIELEPNEASHYANRATCYYWLDEIQLGLDDVEQALLRDPTLARAHNMRGNLLDARGAYEAALAAYTEAIRRDPTSAVYRYNRGKTYSNHNEYDAAIADFTDAILLAPGVALYRSYRANCYYWKNELAQAEADAQAAIELDQTCDHAFNVRGRVRYHRGDFAAAVADFTRAIELVPGDPTYHDNRGKAYEQLGNTEAAQADFAEAERLRGGPGAPQTPPGEKSNRPDQPPGGTGTPPPPG